MKDFHFELPRICDRIPFASLLKTSEGGRELTIGFGRYSLVIGKAPAAHYVVLNNY